MCGFGEYGFPESHSASFALLAYASAWLKHYYPLEFYCSLLNSLPMGFYSASQLIQDAKRHQISVLPVCINSSSWDYQIEQHGDTRALRLGFCQIKGLQQQRLDNMLKRRPSSGFSHVSLENDCCCFYFFGDFFIFAVSTEPEIAVNDPFFVQTTTKSQLRIMSYNVNNLFDAKHDDGAFDYTFLPKTHPDKFAQCQTIKEEYYKKQCEEIDWTNAKLAQKIKQIVKVLAAHGTKPDILALQEIENENVIKLLAKAAGYSQYVVTDYGAHRGVDVVILFNTKKLTLLEEAYVKSPGRSTAC
ncbi:MAG: hypothetical protein U5L01_01000 [Rheinheimera sp.]|nr:hypothetical protein [Rheinheimera sp.]